MIKKILPIIAFLCLVQSNFLFAQDLSASGQVVRHNGDPVSGITVTCSNGDSIITDASGTFTFSGLTAGMDYNIDASYDQPFYDNVSVLDFSYLRFIYLYIVPDPPPSQWIAGDFNQSGGPGGIDLVYLTRAILKIENGSFYPDNPWHFFDNTEDPLSSTFVDLNINLENLTADTSGLEMAAVHVGDVAIESDHLPPPASAPQPIFCISDMSLIQGEEVVIPIKISDFESINGFQHTISWDTSYLEFMDHENFIPEFNFFVNEEVVEDGLLPILAPHINISQTIENDSTIYQVRFMALQDKDDLSNVIGFDSLWMRNEVVYEENTELFIVEAEYKVEASTPTATIDPTNLSTFEITPNPAVDQLNFTVQFDQTENSIITLIDSKGQLIQQQAFNEQLINGEMNISHLPKGNYFLQVRTKAGTSSQAFIKM